MRGREKQKTPQSCHELSSVTVGLSGLQAAQSSLALHELPGLTAQK